MVEHEVIHLSLGANHDIIDGAQLMRFADQLKRNLIALDNLVIKT